MIREDIELLACAVGIALGVALTHWLGWWP